MNILTANVKLYSNLSYSIMARRIMSSLKNMPRIVDEKLVGDPITWFYGEYGSNYDQLIPTELAKLLPFKMEDASNVINAYIQKYKIDIVMMHDDLQRCKWFETVSGAPVLYWVPWDNEDIRSTPDRTTLKHADEIVVVAKFAKDIMAKFGYNVEQVYDPIETDVYKPDPIARETFRNKIGIPEDHKIITFVGRPGWRKRPYHVIKVAAEVIKRNPKVHFLFHSDLNEPSWGGINPQEIFYANGLLEGNKLITSTKLKYDLGFPTDFMNQLYNATDVYFAPHGGEGMCCCGDTEVFTTDKGYVPISDINIGDMVQTKQCSLKVINKFKRNYNGKGIKIERWYDTQPTICTPNHPILTYSFIGTNSLGIDEYKNVWKRADQLELDDRLYIPKLKISKTDIPNIPIVGENLWWFIGLYIAEGSVNKRYVKLYLHKNELDEVEEKLENLSIMKTKSNQYSVSNYLGSPIIRSEYNGNRGVISFASMVVSEYMKIFGNKAYKKCLPEDVFKYLCYSKESRKEFIDGLYYGDGNSNFQRKDRNCKYFSIELTSKKMLEQLQILLQIDGIFSSLNISKFPRKQIIKGKLYNCKESWRLRWSTNRKLVNEIDGGYIVKIKRINEVIIDEPVYNLEVESDNFDNHSYLTKQGIVHNCLPIAEAMSTGKPFVATDYTTTPEFAGYDKGGDLVGTRGCGARIGKVGDNSMIFQDKGVLRPYVDINHMVDQICYLLDNDSVAKKMGEEGRKYAVENIDQKIVAAKIGKIMHRMTDYTGAYID